MFNIDWFTFISGTPAPTDVPTPNPTPGPTAPPGAIKVHYKCAQTGASVNQIKPFLTIVNTSSTSVSLIDLTARYFYTKECTSAEEFHDDYAVLGTGNVNGSFGSGYAELGFAQAAGTLAGGSQTGEIQLRFNKADWTNYDQSNDYSCDGTYSAYADYDRIALYQSGRLIWGIAPHTGTPAPTAIPIIVPTPGATAGSILGDVNVSGSVDIVDALFIAQYYVGTIPSGFDLLAADTNC